MYFPTLNTHALALMGGLNAVNEASRYDDQYYNNPLAKDVKSFKNMHIIPSSHDVPMSPEEMAYNEKAKQHNLHVNDWIDQSDAAWSLAQSRAREMATGTAKIVSEGHKMGLSTAQINAQLKKYKRTFGATGADIIRGARSQASEDLKTAMPFMPRNYTNNADDALMRLGVNPLAYGYNSWNRR
jgi:hypothetical protein